MRANKIQSERGNKKSYNIIPMAGRRSKRLELKRIKITKRRYRDDVAMRAEKIRRHRFNKNKYIIIRYSSDVKE